MDIDVVAQKCVEGHWKCKKINKSDFDKFEFFTIDYKPVMPFNVVGGVYEYEDRS